MDSVEQLLNRYQYGMLSRSKTEQAVKKHLGSLRQPEKQNRFLQAVLASQSPFDAGDKMHREMTGLFLENVADLSSSGLLQGDLLESSKDAYYNNTRFMQFSPAFQQKIFAGFKKFPQVKTHGWDMGKQNLQQQMDYCRDLSSIFVKTYDPANHLDMHDKNLLMPHIQPYDAAETQNFLTYASFWANDHSNIISVKAYLVDSDKVSRDHVTAQIRNAYLMDTVHHSFNDGTGVQPTHKPGYYTIPANEDHDEGVLYIPMFMDRMTSAEVIGHELVHQTLRNIDRLYRENSLQAKKIFDYTPQDHALYVASQVFYVQPKENLTLYKLNAEEVLANKAQLLVPLNATKIAKGIVWHGTLPSQWN